MKVKYSHIVGVNSTQGSVEIKFRPAGSDESDDPEVIHISPHHDYLHLSFFFGPDRDMSVKPGLIEANHAQIDYIRKI